MHLISLCSFKHSCFAALDKSQSVLGEPAVFAVQRPERPRNTSSSPLPAASSASRCRVPRRMRAWAGQMAVFVPALCLPGALNQSGAGVCLSGSTAVAFVEQLITPPAQLMAAACRRPFNRTWQQGFDPISCYTYPYFYFYLFCCCCGFAMFTKLLQECCSSP